MEAVTCTSGSPGLLNTMVGDPVPYFGDSLEEDRLRHRARNGEFNTHVKYALDELQDVLTAIEAALAALTVISLLGELLPSEWSNLPPALLARKLTNLGHTLLRGRIPGVNL